MCIPRNVRTLAALRVLTFLLVGMLGSISGVRGAERSDLNAVFESIQRRELRQHVSVLASDLFEGREAGTRGGKAAGTYVIEQLKKQGGLQPAGSRQSYFQEFGQDYRNILAILPGSDPELKREFIVVGAHYDHVGYGTPHNSFGPVGQIHNGADDNASGTACLLALIRAFCQLDQPPARSILFVFWDAEEKGLLGSDHWTNHPTIPIQHVRFKVNVDMVGRLTDRNLTLYGTRTANGIRRLVSEQNRDGLHLDFDWDIVRESDHYPFVQRRIPYLMLHTGKHADYHRPSDQPDTLNYRGLEDVCRFLCRTTYAVADQADLPAFRNESLRENQSVRQQVEVGSSPLPPRLGASWDGRLSEQGEIRLTRIERGSAAERAGLSPGDRILQFGAYRADRISDFRRLVLAAENPVPVVVQGSSDESPRKVTLQLSGSPVMVGIAWRLDAAEPNCVILNRVVPGSPADRAGLQVNDRIYAVNGQDFTGSEEFRRLLFEPNPTLTFTRERNGRIQTVTLEFLPDPLLTVENEGHEPENRQSSDATSSTGAGVGTGGH